MTTARRPDDERCGIDNISELVQEDRIHKQEGLQTDGNECRLVARGLNEDVVENLGIKHGERGSEIGQRNQHSVWLSLMSNA